MDNTTKTHENRLRRKAARQGLELHKSRLRDPHATGFGSFMLVDADTRAVVAASLPHGYGLDMDDVEQYLTR